MRESGILMHITSLPGPYGVGTMGKEAFHFIDFLRRAGQKCWQVLPLNPTGFGDSPYQSCSAYAGNPYLIDLDRLVEEGLLKREELESIIWFRREEKVDFGIQYENRMNVLRIAYGRFCGGAEFEEFCLKNSRWLADYSLYMALKDAHNGKAWYEWEDALKLRQPDALWQQRHKLQSQIRFYNFVQYLFDKQWTTLRKLARDAGIRIIGDVPIYVPLGSVDVWNNPELFFLDESLTPIAVAGCPPDGFTEDGQLWGNPLYRWDVMEKNGFTWWKNRLAAAQSRYDMVRLDHFRGFEAYWAVPYGDRTARNGKWLPGPGLPFIQAIQTALPELELIAEDLGFLTQGVLDMRNQSGLPGMKVLEFAFDSREPSEYLPHTYTAHSVCYTGTHDNMTMQQWFDTAPKAAVEYAAEYMSLTDKEGYVWGTIRTAMSSVSDLCIVQMQDYLGLGGEARMNFPGTVSDANWTWRAKNGMITEELANKIHRMTICYGRTSQ